MATSNAEGGFKRFSGAGAKKKKRERSEAMEYVVSVATDYNDITHKEARGPFVYSMLDGDALTAVGQG